MNDHEILVQQFVTAIIRIAGTGRTDRAKRIPVPSFGDVEAAVRHHFKMAEADPQALVAAVRKAASASRPDAAALDRALSDLEAAHAQELVARQQTAFLIGMEVGRTARRRSTS